MSHSLTSLHGRLMVSRPSCLAKELRHAPPCRPVSSGRWDIRATWSRSSRGGAMVLGVHRSRSSMIADGPRGKRIPLSPMWRHARSGQHTWLSSIGSSSLEGGGSPSPQAWQLSLHYTITRGIMGARQPLFVEYKSGHRKSKRESYLLFLAKASFFPQLPLLLILHAHSMLLASPFIAMVEWSHPRSLR